MRSDSRLVLAFCFAVAAALAGCGAVSSLTRPEGDGGWDAARRRHELAQRAAVAGVELGLAETAATPTPEIPARFDLQTALQTAARRNREIAAAELQVEEARQRTFEARGLLLPATTASGRYTWYTDSQTTRVNFPPGLLPEGTTTTPDVVVREAENGTVNGTLTLPLDLSGEIRHALAAAQAGYRGEKARLWATTLAQQLAVVRAYFSLLEAERLREVTEQRLGLFRQQLNNAQSLFDNGRATKNELLVVQVALRNAEQERLQRDIAIDQQRWAFNRAVGLPVDAPTEVVDVRARPQLPTAAEALRQAALHNPALAALLEEQQRLQQTLVSLRRSRAPRFSSGAAIDYSSSGLVQPEEIGSGFVGFEWDLGTDTRREARIAAAHAAAERNRVLTEQQLRELETGVRLAQRAAEERLAALGAAEAAVGQAEENLRIRQQQFDAGRATSDDVLEAESLLTGQRATLASALYEAHIRRAELQQLIGLPLDADWEAPPPEGDTR